MFSVILPLYNKENEIQNTINSILCQTRSDFELIIVDDGTTDRSIDIVKSIQDLRISIVHKANNGVSSARNTGIERASAPYIAFIDGDDNWEPDFLQTIYELIHKYPEAAVYGTGFAGTVDGKITQVYVGDKEGILDNYFQSCIGRFLIHSSAVCVKREVFSKVPSFNEKITHGEDIDMWARLAKHFKVAVSTQIKAYYNRGVANSASRKLPPPERTIYYYIRPELMGDNYERIYYRTLILAGVHKYLRTKKIAWAMILIKMHWNFLGIGDYMHFYINKLRRIS
jgi:glycosyltransferase involved in cell wall biosynthesis